MWAAVFAASLLIGISEVVLRRWAQVVQIVKVTYKGDRLGAGGSFKLSKDPILLYEWVRLPQETSEKKEAGVFRILVLGDSVTYRQQWTLQDYFPAHLERLLSCNLQKARRIEVINAGVPGYNTSQEVRYLEKRWLGYLPDLVILAYCAPNDRVIKRRIIAYGDGLYCSDVLESYPYVAILPGGLSEYLAARSALYRFLNIVFIKAARRISPRAFFGGIREYTLSFETEVAISRLRQIASRHRFNLLVVVFPALVPGPQEEADWIVHQCKKYSIAYVDLRPVFEKAGYAALRISDDDTCHLNRQGHLLAAQGILQPVEGLIGK